MKWLLFIGLVLSFLTFSISLYSQQLRVGQQLPASLAVKNVLNIENEMLDISAIHDKIIILDFWRTSCIPCIQAFPKLDSLQHKYNNVLQIVLVTKESRDSVIRFFGKRRKIKIPALPVVTGDTTLCNLFPPDSYPYTVWIDKNQTIKYISSAVYFTEKNAAAFIHTGNVQTDIALKKVHFGNLFNLADEDAARQVKYYSHISSCIDSINVGAAMRSTDETNHSVSMASNCASISELFKKAFSEFYKFNFDDKNSIELKVKQKSRYIRPADPEEYEDWYPANSYNYELCLPERMAGKMYQIMQRDLMLFFNIDAYIARKAVKSYVLIRTSSKNKIKTKGGPASDHFHFSSLEYPGNDSIKYVTNMSFQRVSKEILEWLSYYTHMPCYDKTGIKEKVDVSILTSAVDPLDINLLRNELKKYDLALLEKYIIKEVLVIHEK